MLKFFLLSSLLLALSGCPEQVIGEAYDGGADEVPGGSGGASVSVMVAASESIGGRWLSMPDPFGFGPTNVTVTFSPRADSVGGTYHVVCPERCPPKGGDAGLPEFIPDSGEYAIVGFNSAGKMRGILYTDDFTFGMTFDFPHAGAMPPSVVTIEVIPLSLFLAFERLPPGAP